VGTAQRQAKFGQKYVDEVIIEKFLWELSQEDLPKFPSQ